MRKSKIKPKPISLSLICGDIISKSESEYIKQLQRLWDMLSDCVEGGRLTEADIPDDYKALVRQMVKLANLDGRIMRENNAGE